MFLAPMPSWEGGRGGRHRHVKKAFINALFLAYRNFANSKIKSMNIAMVDVPRVYSMPMLYPYMNIVWMQWLHIYISAWGSALLVQLDWAMRRPLYAGRVMIQAPALFLYGCNERKYHKNCSVWGACGQKKCL